MKTMNTKRHLSITAILVLLWPIHVFADILLTPDSISYVTIPNQAQTGLNLDDENNIINGNGLSGTPDINNWQTITHAAVNFSAPGNAWATIDPGPAGGYFFDEGGVAPVFEMAITSDPASPYINSIIFWGYHFGGTNGNSVSRISLEFSSDNGATIFDSRNDISIPLTAEQAVRAMFAPVLGDTNFIRMTVTDNHFGNAAGGDRVGIAELRFTAIPEPTSAVALLPILMALISNRRRTTSRN